MNEKQFDALIGISRNMEKSLLAIEKSLNQNDSKERRSEKGSSHLNILAGLAKNLQAIVAATSIKSFDSKKANKIVSFSRDLVNIASEINPDSAKAFGQFASGFSKAFDTIFKMMEPGKMIKLYLAGKILFWGKKPLLKTIIFGLNSAFKGIDPLQIKSVKALHEMGEGLLSLTKALKSFILIGMAAPVIAIGALVVRGIISLFSSFGEKAKSIKAGGEALKELGKGLISFSAGIASIALATLIAGKEAIKGISLIALFGLTFYTLGKVDESIRKGAKAVAYMGLALFGFSAGIAAYSLVMLLVSPASILQGIATIAGFGVVFALLGIDKVSQSIARGALLLIGMSLALFLFSGGLMVYSMAIKMFDSESLFTGAALIAEMGLAMAVLGKFEKWIRPGAIAMVEMGVGLGLFSVGLSIFGLIIKLFDLESVAIGAAVITGIGIATSIVGVFESRIVPGSLALAEMGTGLIFFSVGILSFGIAIKLLQTIFDKDLAIAGKIAGGIILGLGLAFVAVGFASKFISPGAAAMILVGVALISVSVGILVFALAIKALQALFKDLPKAGTIAGGILLGLGLAFTAIGVMSPLIMFGSVAAVSMGAAIALTSVGILSFGLALKLFDSTGMLVKEGNSYTIKGLSVISQIASEISKVGLHSLNPFFWMGISTSLGIGISLVSIGAGLAAAGAALKEATPDVLSKITSGVFGDGGLVTVLAEQFSKIGKKYRGGFLTSFLGKDDVSLGIQITRGFGEVLKDLAGGIVAFSNFTEFPVKVPNPKDPSNLVYTTVDIFGEVIPKLNENLPTLLSTLAQTFSSIGETYGGESGWLRRDSTVKKGVDAVRGLGRVLSEVAGGIIAFSQFDAFPVQVPDSRDPSKLIYSTVNLFDTLPKIKQALIGEGTIQGELTSESGILYGLAEVFAQIGKKYGSNGFFSDNKVKKGVEAVQGIGGVISELAQGIIAFATMERGLPNYDEKGKFNGTYTPFDFNKVKDNLTKVLTFLPTLFADLDGKSMNHDMITQLNSLANVIEKFSRSSDGLKNFADNLVSAGNAFKTFSTGFSTFSTQLDKFSKFENSFSNLVKNQSYYKFNDFAKSMRILKENVNSFKIDNLKLTDSMMKSLAILSKSPDTGDKIKESIDKAMKQLVEAIKRIAGSSEKQSGAISQPSQSLSSSMLVESKSAEKVVTSSESKTSKSAEKVVTSSESKTSSSQQGQDVNAQLLAAINNLNSKLAVLSNMNFESGALKVKTE